MEKVRIFFKVQTNYQLFMVNLVFALTGTSSLVCADYILKILYVNPDTFGIASLLDNKNYSHFTNLSGAAYFCWSYIWRVFLFLGNGKKNIKKIKFNFLKKNKNSN